MLKEILLTLAVLFFSSAAFSEPKYLKILVIGDTFAENATKYLQEVVEASGNQLNLKIASVSSASLEDHLNFTRIHEKDILSIRGKPYIVSKDKRRYSLKELLLSNSWDIVTIQQTSSKSYLSETYNPYGKNLQEFIKKYSPKAEIRIFQTWSYAEGETRIQKKHVTYDLMYKGLKEANSAIAKELNIKIVPVGDAIWQAYKSTELKSKLYQKDKSNINITGEYLAALVCFENLYGQSCVGNSFRIKQVNEEEIKLLQELAHKAVIAE
jgi:hypothetical protein